MADHPLVTALHAGISRRSWNEVEQAANRIRDEGLGEAAVALRFELEQQRYENGKLYDDAKKRALALITPQDLLAELLSRVYFDGMNPDTFTVAELRRAV